ncbi:hypothetical protein SAMN04487934_11415 [Eubacterium ruminantium]|nr:hypothetical protein SAMN04487934_11415 [Eubacterium ruminantium]
MSNKVYSYANISELKSAPFYSEILTLPQIAMSKEISSIRFKIPALKKKIVSFNVFEKYLFFGWNDASQRFKYVTMLNHFIRERIYRTTDKYEREWLFGCKKNINVAINNIIKLEEAQVKPADIVDDDRDIRIFKEMWNTLIESDNTISDFRKKLTTYRDPENFTKAVEAAMENLKVDMRGKKIILNGFQFFTPIQRFVYECFVKAGFEIIALIQDDERYPYANEIWNHLYTEKNGFPSRKEWIRQKVSKTNPLGEIFETGATTRADNLKLIKYRNTIEFIEDIKRIKDDGYYIYSADDHAANKMLRDYFPENYEVRNLLAYPIGQFIYTLHKMWDENLECITLTQDGLRKCFASGWLSYKGRSSTKYTEPLERILPYFDNCYSINDWQERLNILCDAYDDAVDQFKVDSGNKETVKAKELLGNPFKNFAVFSVEEEKMEAVIGVMKQLIKMANTLFGKNEPVSIQKHMSKLDAMLQMNDGMPSELFVKERETVKKIFDALASEHVRDFLCYPGDLAAAMLYYMNDKLDDEEVKKDRPGILVFNIFQVESAPIASKGKVHICMADIQKLPGAYGRYSWPLDEKLLEDVYKNTHNSYVREWLDNNKLTALSNRYYTYIALQNDDVEISWIQKQGDKLLSPSPYVTLLDKLTNSKIQECEIRNINLQHVSDIRAIKKLDKTFDITRSENKYQYEAELEYSLCPMRFVYSYILNDSPVYRNEYQQNMAIVRYIQALNTLLEGKYDIEYIAEQVFELIPGIRKAEKRQIIDDAKRWDLPYNEGGYTDFRDKAYTDYRINLKFLDKDVFKAAKSQADMLMSQYGRKNIEYTNIGPDNEKICVFCPHATYCRRSLFGVDYKGDDR